MTKKTADTYVKKNKVLSTCEKIIACVAVSYVFYKVPSYVGNKLFYYMNGRNK